MRWRRNSPLYVNLAFIVIVVVGIAVGAATGSVIGLVVIGVLAILGHLWFTTWGPSSEPNRFHRRDLWENKRRVHKELRHRDHGHE